jgi:protein arginine kinase activator
MSEEEDEITCQSCRSRPATWHLTDFVGGEAIQQHFCEECYKQRDDALPSETTAFASLIAAMVPELKEMALRQCPQCGLDYLEFRQTLRLGCPNDYEAFDQALERLLERIHGATRHTGKAARLAVAEQDVRARLRSLRKEQKEAIAREDYEQAAQLRDRIREIQEHGLDATEG